MSRWSSPPRLAFTRIPIVCAALLGAIAGCAEKHDERDQHNPHDQDWETRPAWVHAQATGSHMLLREALTNTKSYEFLDGWYAVENDAKTGGAWRWMSRRGIIRIRTRPSELGSAGMNLTIFGWTPHEHLGLLTSHLEFSVNGHVLDRLEPPKRTFEHTIFVPRWLLEKSEWVDIAIRAANSTHAGGDWRELGFATTGFHWTPVALN